MGVGCITVDSREKDAVLLAAADARADLKRDDVAGRSFDIEVLTAAGQTIRFERKSLADAIQSFEQGKLADQAAGAGAIIVEWNQFLVSLMPKERQALALNMRKQLRRMALSLPVVLTDTVEDTVDFLRYLKAQDKPVEVFRSRMRVDGDDPRMAMLSALPGINPERALSDGRKLGAALWSHVDAPALVAALGVDRWCEEEGIGPKRVQSVREALSA